MADTRMADISEFQSSFDADAYLKGGYRAVIVRTYNGSRNDHCMTERRDYVRTKGFTAVGWYCYLKSSVDPVSQAKGFIASVGSLRANEFPILDLEEGGGNQTPRAQAWFDVVDPWAGFKATLYSGQSFLNSYLGGSKSWGDRPIWMAAYSSTEPKDAHTFWQNTDSAVFPGLSGSVDGSIFHGSVEQFLAAVRKGVKPAPAPKALDPSIASIVKQDGRIEVFALKDDGTVMHAWQTATNGGWTGSQANKQAASWSSLGKP